MSIKEKSSWTSIPIKVDLSGPQDLISFEELVDYKVENEKEIRDTTTSSPEKLPNRKRKRRLERLKELKEKKSRLLENENEDASSKQAKIRKNEPRNRKKAKKMQDMRVECAKDSMQEENERKPVADIDMSGWDALLVPDEVKRALKEMSFSNPTKIQVQVIKTAIQSKMDVVAAAETGSGKTLAFGIPLLHHMMEDRARGLDKIIPDLAADNIPVDEDELDESQNPSVDDEEARNVATEKILPALILAPTRELAIQVKDHLSKVGKYTSFKMAAIVGGISVQKQERLLRAKPDIIIATPGRLWEFIEQGNEYLANLHLIRYLVIDEADRMLEKGHFDGLVKILDVVNGKGLKNAKRQTFMFSATLTTVHQAPSRLKAKGKPVTKTVKLGTLMNKIGIKEQKHVVDLTTKKGTASNLYEAKIICGVDEKDLYMYYFLRSHPGRTLIFTNSIDCIFHVTGVLQALSITPLHLHAKMQQRQRLKHLERFCTDQDSVLVASDVAARGLDIPDVQHVLHYQVPRTCETYIHRSGRCARTGKEGLSLLLVSPEELSSYKKLCRSMKLENGIPQFPHDKSSLAAIKKIVRLAKEIDSLGHRRKKVRLNNDWFSKAAAEMDIELDEDMLMRDDDGDDKEALLQQKQKQLKLLMKRPILPRWFSGKYLTKSGKLDLPKTERTSAIEEVKKALKKR